MLGWLGFGSDGARFWMPVYYFGVGYPPPSTPNQPGITEWYWVRAGSPEEHQINTQHGYTS